MNEINLVVSNKLRPWQYVAKDIIAALSGVEDSLGGSLTTLEGRVTDLEGRATAVEGRVTAVEGRATTVEGKVSTLEGSMTTAEAAITALEGRMTTAESDIDAVEGRATAVEGRVTAVEGDVSDLQTRMTAVEGRATAVEGRVTAAEASISALQTTYAATDTYGITKITDSISTTEIEAGMAASPKAVYDALQAAYSYADTQLSQGIAGAYKYKGSVTDVTALPASDAEGLQVGDIYNVQGTTDGENDGVNYAWTGSSWDNLGGIFKVEAAITDGNATSMNPISTKGAKDYVDAEISGVNSTISGVATRVTALEGRMTTAEGDIDAVESRATAVEGRVTAVEGRATAVEGRATAIEGRLDSLDGGETPANGRMSIAEDDIDTLEDQMNASNTGVLARLSALETGAPTSVTAVTEAAGSTVTVTKDSDAVAIYNTTGTFTLAFTAATASDYAVKEILLHAVGDTTLTVTGAVFADAEQDPDWGVTGYELYLRATFINGEVILQVLSNSQEAYNTTQYTPA